MKKIELTRLLDLSEQALKEAIAWHESNNHFQTKREKNALESGYNKGFRDALSILKLHADLKII